MTQGIALAMPASWSSIDLDPDTREESSRRIAKDAIPSGPGAAEARGLMLGLLRQATEEAVERKAVLAALYSSAADGIPLGASLVASVLPATAGPDGQPPPDGQALADSLRGTVGGGERHDLPCGPGVRVRRRQDTQITNAAVAVEVVQWFVLHPSGDRMAVLSFSTPNLALAEPFGEVFDAIAWSLQWTD